MTYPGNDQLCSDCGALLGEEDHAPDCTVDPAHTTPRLPVEAARDLWSLWSETYGDPVCHGIFTTRAAAEAAQRERGTMWHGRIRVPDLVLLRLQPDGEYVEMHRIPPAEGCEWREDEEAEEDDREWRFQSGV